MFQLEILAKLIDDATAHLEGADPAELQLTRARLFAVLDDPTQETWDDAFSILVSPTMTLWKSAVQRAGYPVIARPVGEGWPIVPTAAQLRNALQPR